MTMVRNIAALAMVATVALTASADSTSAPAFVFLAPKTSSFWHTATNNVMTLPISYPEGASSFTLTVHGLQYDRSYADQTGDSFELTLPAPTSPTTENVYDLTLTFDDGTVRSAKLGLIQGHDVKGEGATRCIIPAAGRKWRRVGNRAVLPIPYGMETFDVTINGQAVSADTGLDGAQGWYALGGIHGDDVVGLTLTTADGAVRQASLLGRVEGFFLMVK